MALPASPVAPPVAAFAMTPKLFPDLFPEDVCKRIHGVSSVLADIVRVFSPRLERVEVLLTGWGCPKIDEPALTSMPSLRAVIHAAGSVKGHVSPAVFDRGIMVSSAAAVNARPVAEYTVAALVLGLKHAFRLHHGYSRGLPVLAHRPGDRSGVSGTVIGVVGASRIGRIVATMLKPYDVRVLMSDPHVPDHDIRALGAEPSDLDTLCSACDAVTIHAPELDETRNLFDDRRLGLLRDGTLLINTARGSLIDTEALTAHCRRGRLDAILDVTAPEPLPAKHPLLHLPNVVVTPHIAGSRGRELRLLGAHAAAELERLVAGQPLQGLISHLDLPHSA